MNCPFSLKYAFLLDGTIINDFSVLDDQVGVIYLSRYPNLVKK